MASRSQTQRDWLCDHEPPAEMTEEEAAAFAAAFDQAERSWWYEQDEVEASEATEEVLQ